MRLAYITSAQISNKDAQSLQITAMAQSFSFQLEFNNFILISPLNKINENFKTKYNWKKIAIINKPRWLRYLLIILISFGSIVKFKPEIIYSRDIFVVLFYRLLGYNAVYEIHKPFETFLGDLCFSLIKNKIKIIAISQALKDFIINKYLVNKNNILVAHDGVWLENFINLNKISCRQKLLDTLDLKDSSFVVVYSGNLVVGGKGIGLITAAAMACPDISFVVVGGKNNLDTNFPNLLFIDRVFVESIPSYLVAADVLLLPFTKELKTHKYHSALKMFEYMASSVPVVASDIGSIKEIFNKDNAFLFDPENINSLIDCLNFIRKNPNIAIQKSQQAFLGVKNYTWPKRAERILDFLKFDIDGSV